MAQDPSLVWQDEERDKLLELAAENTRPDQIAQLIEGKTVDQISVELNKMKEIEEILKKELTEEIKTCHTNSNAVNIKIITEKLQNNFNESFEAIDLSAAYWQSVIARNMAKLLSDWKFEQRNTDDTDDDDDDDDDDKDNDEVIEPGATTQNMNDIWSEIQKDIEEQEKKMNIHQENKENDDSNNTNDINIFYGLKWKKTPNFEVKYGITTTQIIKTNGGYSSITSLEPMIARRYKYTFLISNLKESGRDKPWMGIGVISSKCPLLSNNKLISWHASNEYSVGWYYGTDIWHNHAPLQNNYGSGQYWKNGDELTLEVDCKQSTIKYFLNGKDLGFAVKNFNKLLNSDINDRFYVIISIRENMNSLTLMDSVIYGDDKKIEQQNNNKWKTIFKPFAKKTKKKNNNNKNNLNRSKSVDIKHELKQKEPNQDENNKDNEEIKLLKNKLSLQTKISVAMKQKYENILNKHRDLEKLNYRNERELKKFKQEIDANKKELSLSRGNLHELKKLNLEQLHELQTNLMSSIQNVQKAIDNIYDNKYNCRICLTNEKDIVLMPCAHFVCSECVEKIDMCPLCRRKIENIVKIN